MIALSIAEVLAATNGRLLHGDLESSFSGYSTDSRTIRQGNLYIPLIGERHDGNDFIPEVLEKGASWSLISDVSKMPAEEALEGKGLIYVHDTVAALQSLASYLLKKRNIPVVGITGSTGKTSTKEMVAAVLGTRFKVLKNEGNLNNHIGLPLTCLQLEEDHEMAVLEMGMNHFGEIARLAEITRPCCAIITNIGLSHIQNLGSRDGIFRAKMEIAQYMTAEDTLFVNGDDEYLRSVKGLEAAGVVRVGATEGCECHVTDWRLDGALGSEFRLEWPDSGFGPEEYRLNVPGCHNIQNASLAIAAGLHFGIPPERIREGLTAFRNNGMRLNIAETDSGVTLINDAYNASPDSMKAALQVLQTVRAGRRVAALSDMLEMGDEAERAHRLVGELAAEYGVDHLFTWGPQAVWISEGARAAGMEPENVRHFESREALTEALRELLASGDAVLVKGSRGMKMERVAEAVEEMG